MRVRVLHGGRGWGMLVKVRWAHRAPWATDATGANAMSLLPCPLTLPPLQLPLLQMAVGGREVGARVQAFSVRRLGQQLT